MSRFRLRTWCVAMTLTAGAIIALHGQAVTESSGLVIQNVGLPAIDVGLSADETHAPNTPESRRRTALRTAPSLRADRVGVSGVHYAPGRVIVKFRDGASTADRLAAVGAAARGGAIAERKPHTNFDMVSIDPDDDAEAVARAFSERPEVEYAQPSYRVHTRFKPNDPLYATQQWNLPLINLEAAWDIQPQAGSAITVAVLDTGMAYQNATLTMTVQSFRDERGVLYPALGAVTIPYSGAPQLMSAGRFVAPRDFIWDTAMPLDYDGHGTHVSGTIGQLTNDSIGTAGVAFNVKLMPVKVIDTDWDVIFRSPHEGTDDIVAQGIRYAADNGAKIINMSIGRSGPATCGTNPNLSGCAPAIESAIRYAVGKGCFIAVAGGNELEDTVPPYGRNPTSVIADIASRVAGAVSVAAVDRSKAHASYSSTGSYIELAAPGGSSRDPNNSGFVRQQTFDFAFTDTFLLSPAAYHAPRFDVFGYVGYTGTSMAVPHVSGVAAMMMQQGITDPAAIEAAMERFATDLGSPGRDDTFGFGLIDARASLRGLGLAK